MPVPEGKLTIVSLTQPQYHVCFFYAKGTPARWRDFHSATIIGTKMFVFGGRADRFGPFHSNNEIYCNKIKVFDTETNCWLSTPSTQPLPEGRRSHSACKTQRHTLNQSHGQNLNHETVIAYHFFFHVIH